MNPDELMAGLTVGVLGYTMTFIILIILSICIKLSSITALKLGPKKVAEVEKPKVVAEEKPEVLPEELAAAVAAVEKYIQESVRPAIYPQPVVGAPTISAVNAWVVSSRLETREYLGDFVYIKKSRKR